MRACVSPPSSRQAVVFLMLAMSVFSRAALIVGPGGLLQQTFDTLPPVSSWSTYSMAGSAGDIEAAAALDVAVQAISATNVTTQLLIDQANPPSHGSTARWTSIGLYIQTRPTGNAFNLLMATLQNGAGTNIANLTVTYDFQQRDPAFSTEAVQGHRMYYSFTGATGTWSVVGSFGTTSPVNTPQPQLMSLEFPSSWPAGSTLFLLFADENSSVGGEPANGIDNFAVTVGFPPPSITEQPTNTMAVMGTSATLRVLASGAPPLGFHWRFQGAPILGATNRTLTLPNVQPTNAGAYDVVVSNAFGIATSSLASLTVLVPPGFNAQPTNQAAQVGGTVSFTVSASGTEPFSYQWRFNGTNIAGATNQALTIGNAQFTNAGTYSVVVSNGAGTNTSANAMLWLLGGIDLHPGLPIHGPVGATFRIEYSTDLNPGTNGTWTVLTNFVLPANHYLFVDPTPARAGKRFYRALLVP